MQVYKSAFPLPTDMRKQEFLVFFFSKIAEPSRSLCWVNILFRLKSGIEKSSNTSPAAALDTPNAADWNTGDNTDTHENNNKDDNDNDRAHGKTEASKVRTGERASSTADETANLSYPRALNKTPNKQTKVQFRLPTRLAGRQ